MKIIRLLSSPYRQRMQASAAQVASEARHWVIRLDGEALTPEERQELQAWLSRSPAHPLALRETAQLWGSLDQLASIVDGETEAEDRQRPQRVVNLRPWVWSGVSLVMLTAVFLLTGRFGWQQQDWQHVYATQVGEVRNLELPDGSAVTLDTASQLQVGYNASRRSLVLPAGQAYFQVAHDPDKPFMVHAGPFAVRAIGTAFSVLAEGEDIQVMVTEGEVQVKRFAEAVTSVQQAEARSDQSGELLAPLREGRQGLFSLAGDGLVMDVQDSEPRRSSRQLAWREGYLSFEDDRFADVVQQLNRYSRRPLQIADAGLAEQRFGGYFRVDDIDSILRAFQQHFGIVVEESPDYIVLRRQDTEG